MIHILDNCTFVAEYESLDYSYENFLLQKRLYPGENDIYQGTNIVQILIDENFENGSFSPKTLHYTIGKEFSHPLTHDGKYTYFSIRLWTLEGWNNHLNELDVDVNLEFSNDEEEIIESEIREELAGTTSNIFYIDYVDEDIEKPILCRNGEEVQIEDLVDALLSGFENWGCLELQRKDVFSLCYLEKCVAQLQKETVVNGLNTSGNKTCLNKSDLSEQRDFLFITFDLLKMLVNKELYEQAQQILNDINTKCGWICKSNSVKNNCNCR